MSSSRFASAVVAMAMLSPLPAMAQQQRTVPSLSTVVAFPNLKFSRPVTLAYPNDDRNLLFVVEQHEARIQSFSNDPNTRDKQLFLQLPREISRDNEEGLLGLAFHPKYKENGQFFVYYSAQEGPTNRRSVVSRFNVLTSDPRKADPDSEVRIWQSEPDPFGNHNGGHIEFGPDGFLYITLGDSGAADDPLLSGQNPSDFWGSILRIDVDHPSNGKPYGIPKTNPRVRDPRRFGAWAPEVYAIGLRNVWKFSFDRETGWLWAGDVGQNLWEEIDIIINGGNYGWSVVEGFHPFPKRQRRPVRSSDLIPPVVEYPHPENKTRERPDDGKSVTGGYVYRGKALPELVGAYVYADFETGRIWALRVNEKGKLLVNREVVDLSKNPRLQVSSFGEDPAGELYILAFDGRIHQFKMAE